MNWMKILFLSCISGILVYPTLYAIIPFNVIKNKKSNFYKRISAFLIDLLPCFFIYPLFLWSKISFLLMLVFYLLIKDSIFSGKSPGKLILGLQIIQVNTGKRCNFFNSIIRNIFIAIPVLNTFGIPFEFFCILKNIKGIRLGDKIAKTQVVEFRRLPELNELFNMFLSRIEKYSLIRPSGKEDKKA